MHLIRIPCSFSRNPNLIIIWKRRKKNVWANGWRWTRKKKKKEIGWKREDERKKREEDEKMDTNSIPKNENDTFCFRFLVPKKFVSEQKTNHSILSSLPSSSSSSFLFSLYTFFSPWNWNSNQENQITQCMFWYYEIFLYNEIICNEKNSEMKNTTYNSTLWLSSIYICMDHKS